MNPRPQNDRSSTTKEVPMDNDNETIGGYAVPVDPMDMLQCESCQ